MTYPAVIFLLGLISSLFGPSERMLYLWGGSVAFGALALVPPEVVGGLNLLPGTTVALVMIVRAVLDKRGFAQLPRLAFELDAMILLTVFACISVISAVFYPRIFAGEVLVVPMRGDQYELGPSMANFTQLSYLLISCLTAIVARQMAERDGFVDIFLRSVLIGGALVFVTGLISLVLGPNASIISGAFKTAKYAYLEGSEVGGFRRVDGFMTEASAFGGSCVGIAGILLFLGGELNSASERLAAKLVGWSLVVMSVLSTSSAAYMGLAVLLLVYGATSFVRALRGRLTLTLGVAIEIIAIVIVILVAIGGVISSPELLNQPREMLDVILFKKIYSSSYYERNLWNRMAMEALGQTWGVGVGVGGARASNWVVAVLSNTGVVGGLALFGFMARLLMGRPNSADRISAVNGFKLIMLIDIVPRVMVATTPDFGVGAAIEFGILAAFTASRRSSPQIRHRA